MQQHKDAQRRSGRTIARAPSEMRVRAEPYRTGADPVHDAAVAPYSHITPVTYQAM